MCRAVLLCLVLLGPATSFAGVPSPSNSTVPCFLACPGGDLSIVITVRDLAGNPVAGSAVAVEFCQDGSPALATPDFRYTFAFCCQPGCGAVVFTAADGRATFQFPAGGVSDNPATANIRADGVLLGTRSIASPDQNGDGAVDAADLAIATALLGLPEPSADLDCDSVVDPDDLALLASHDGHHCDCPVPAHGTTWGSVKVRYR